MIRAEELTRGSDGLMALTLQVWIAAFCECLL